MQGGEHAGDELSLPVTPVQADGHCPLDNDGAQVGVPQLRHRPAGQSQSTSKEGAIGMAVCVWWWVVLRHVCGHTHCTGEAVMVKFETV